MKTPLALESREAALWFESLSVILQDTVRTFKYWLLEGITEHALLI